MDPPNGEAVRCCSASITGHDTSDSVPGILLTSTWSGISSGNTSATVSAPPVSDKCRSRRTQPSRQSPAQTETGTPPGSSSPCRARYQRPFRRVRSTEGSTRPVQVCCPFCSSISDTIATHCRPVAQEGPSISDDGVKPFAVFARANGLARMRAPCAAAHGAIKPATRQGHLN